LRQRWNRLLCRHRYGARGLTDLGCAYESIGAAERAAVAHRIANVDLDRMNELVCARGGDDYGSIRALVERQMTGNF
jgi:hypothetical protein